MTYQCPYCGKQHGIFSTSEPACEAEYWLINYGTVMNQMDICLVVCIGIMVLGMFNIIPGFVEIGILGVLISTLGSYLLHREFNQIAKETKRCNKMD